MTLNLKIFGLFNNFYSKSKYIVIFIIFLKYFLLSHFFYFNYYLFLLYLICLLSKFYPY